MSKIKPAVAPRHPFSEFFSALRFAALVAFLLKTFIVEAYHIPTGSMENTLKVGDFILVNKFLTTIKTPSSIPFTDVRLPHVSIGGMREPKRGDVLVFDWQGNANEVQHDEITMLVKRCVGLPGDTITIRDKNLFVNGEAFPRPAGMQYLHPVPEPKDFTEPDMFPPGAPWNRDQYGPLRVPQKGDVIPLTAHNLEQWRIFILREGHSIAQRGSELMIDGSPATSYTVARNYYFMMGDNRDNSSDSRFWGFVADDDIAGAAMFTYWSWDPSIPFTSFGKLLASVRWNRILRPID